MTTPNTKKLSAEIELSRSILRTLDLNLSENEDIILTSKNRKDLDRLSDCLEEIQETAASILETQSQIRLLVSC
jgi:hypothetical protein